MLSASGEEADVLEAVKVGATGYLLKGSTAGEIVNASRASIGIFGVTLIKMVGGDLRSIGPVHRIVSFAGIGALLLACSLLFHRVKHVVLGGERDGAGGA